MGDRSIAYANMRRALLSYVRGIPSGRVVEIGTLAESLNIPARHAAHILSRLSAEEAEMIPWHRVVPRAGIFRRETRARPRTETQLSLLRGEGLPVDRDGRIALAHRHLWQPPDEHRSTLWADLDMGGPRRLGAPPMKPGSRARLDGGRRRTEDTET